MVTKTFKPSKETSVLIRLRNQAKNKKLRPRTSASIDFYIKAIQRLGNINRTVFKRDRALIKRPKMEPGRLMFFEYDAITPDLPYFDRFPMTLIIDMWKNDGKTYFSGLNFHYLPVDLRYKLMIKLIEYKSNTRYDNTTKIKLSYELLKNAANLNEFKPCYKHYLVSQVRSNMMQIEMKYFEAALGLPLAKWAKGSAYIGPTRDPIEDALNSLGME